MQMKFNILAVLFLIVVISILSSCKDACDECINDSSCIDEVCVCSIGYEGDNCEIKSYLLKRVMKNNAIFQEYDYDDQNRLVQMIETAANNPVTTFDYSYYSDTTLIKLSTPLSIDTTTYHIISNPMTLEFIYNKDESPKPRETYSNQIAECGFSQGQVFNLSGDLERYMEIEYSDRCNVILTTYSASNGGLLSNMTIVLDESEYIHQSENLKGIDLQSLFLMEKGNFKKVSFESGNEVVDDLLSYESTFSLNDDHFPTFERREYQNGTIEEYGFIYY